MTQKRLCEQIPGVTEFDLSQWKKGSYLGTLTAEKVRAIAKVLGVEPEKMGVKINTVEQEQIQFIKPRG